MMTRVIVEASQYRSAVTMLSLPRELGIAEHDEACFIDEEK